MWHIRRADGHGSVAPAPVPTGPTEISDEAAAAIATAAAAAAAATLPAVPVLSEKDRIAISKKRYAMSYIIATTPANYYLFLHTRLRNKLNAQTQRDKTKASMAVHRKLIEEMRSQEIEVDAAIEEVKRKLMKYE